MKKRNIIIILLEFLLLIGVNSAYAWNQTTTCRVTTEDSKKGLVAAASGKDIGNAIYQIECNVPQTTSGAGTDHYVTMKAQPNGGFFFEKWRTDKKREGIGNDGKDTDNPRIINSYIVKGTFSLGEYTALFQAVQVNDVANASYTISTKDLGGTGTCDVVFNVNKATSSDDYKVELQQNGSALQVQGTSYNGTQVTVTVQYTDNNHHGTGIYNGTVTLTSKGDNSSATATITASSYLTPTFDLVGNLAFGDNVDVYVGSQVAASVEPTSKNKVASQPSPMAAGNTGLVWNATITGADAAAFQLESGNPVDGKCNIIFAPQEARDDYQATLTLSAQYTDAYGNTINSEKSVYLSGIAKQSEISQIDFVPSSFDFAAMCIGDAVQSKEFAVSKQNVGDIKYQWTTAYSDVFVYDASVAGKVTITAKPTFPGTYTTALKASGADTRTGQNGITTAELPVSVSIGLQKPTLRGTATLDSAYLYWNKIDFADTYTIYEVNGSTETVVEPKHTIDSENSVTAIFAQNTTKTYKVLAKGVYNGTEYSVWTDAISLTRGTLTAGGVQYWNLYTGTQCTSVGGFSGGTSAIVKKKRVDLSHTFDKNGKALFDELYVFEETISSDGATKITAATADNEGTAVTPCYVFKKNSDNSYLYDRTIANVGTATKQLPTADTHNWTTNGSLKLYFTGWCPFGSNGYTTDDEGVIYIKGSAGTSVDIYLEDCQLYGRQHTRYGNSISKDNMTETYKVGSKYSQGSGSAIVVESSAKNQNNPFKVSIHTRGDNVLYSIMGCPTAMGIQGTKLYAACGQYSASIQVHAVNSDSKTILCFDDKWPYNVNDTGDFERTNGFLRLQKSGANSPSIDYGTKYGEVNFNGGRIELQNSVSSSDHYSNTLAICYRTGNSDITDLGLGIGEDGVEGTVNFNDGTIYTSSVKPKSGQEAFYEPLDSKGYSTTLRCPQNTYIKGGSHISEIRACPSVSSTGASPTDGVRSLVKLDYKVEEQYVDKNTGLALPGFFPDEIECEKCGENGEDIMLNLTEYYTNNASLYPNGFYGIESVSPDDNGYVHLWVPGVGKKAYNIVPWVVCMPNIEVSYPGMDDIKEGGDQVVNTDEDSQVQHLFYTKIDSRMSSIFTDNYEAPVQKLGTSEYMKAKVSNPGKNLYYSVTNDEPYTIYDDIYYFIAIEATDTWVAFCPPFDVSEIFVIETYSEQELEKLDNETALSSQAKYNLDFASIIGGNIALAKKINRNKPYSDYYNEFLKYAYVRDTGGMVGNDKQVRVYPRPEKGYSKSVPKDYIDNYVGRRDIDFFRKGNWNANYFLYKSASKQWAYVDGAFTTDWECASSTKKTIGEDERNVVMEAGEVYTMMFPYGGKEGTWDYWTGKLLVLKGYGPQILLGTNAQADVVTPFSESNMGVLRGNSTFAILNVDNTNTLKNAFFQGDGQSAFVLDNTHSAMGKLPAGGVFMLANGSMPLSAPTNAKAINIRSGAVTYENGTDAEAGVPTIAGGRSLIVNSVAGGIEVVPVVAQQVSVYGSAGQLIMSDYLTGETTIALPAGIYIVRGEKEMVKVVVR